MTICMPRGCDARTARGRRRDDLGEALLEVLVRRAVLAARQRDALARRPLARAGVTAERAAVDRQALLLTLRDVPVGDAHVAVDHPVDAHLTRHREMRPDVVEQRARRAREVVAIAREARERALTCVEQVAAGLRRHSVLDDHRTQLAIHGATELVHIPLPPSL
jgi:hypothetical protein